MELPFHLKAGQEAETQAIAWYLARHEGSRILAKNWRVPQGEIDWVVHDCNQKVLVFLEVRRRTQIKGGEGALQSGIESVRGGKLKRLKRAIDLYLMNEEIPQGLKGMQLDVLDFDGVQFKHFENILLLD